MRDPTDESHLADACRSAPTSNRTGRTHFRVWAPGPRDVALVIDRGRPGSDATSPLEREARRLLLGARAGRRRRRRGIATASTASCSPIRRRAFSRTAPFGPSEVVDPVAYRVDGRGVARRRAARGRSLYEMHLGTFTPEGTWRARDGAAAAAGATSASRVIEVMPVAEFPGRFGWGYDGVFPYAPTRLYGTPDDFRALRRSRARARPRRDSRRRLQPLRARRLRLRRVSPSSYFTDAVRQRVGRRR